jgi:hypothetical protein
MYTPTFIKTFNVASSPQMRKVWQISSTCPKPLTIVDQAFPNNFLSLVIVPPILVKKRSFHSIQTVQRIIPQSKDQIPCKLWIHEGVLAAKRQCFKWSEGSCLQGTSMNQHKSNTKAVFSMFWWFQKFSAWGFRNPVFLHAIPHTYYRGLVKVAAVHNKYVSRWPTFRGPGSKYAELTDRIQVNETGDTQWGRLLVRDLQRHYWERIFHAWQ